MPYLLGSAGRRFSPLTENYFKDLGHKVLSQLGTYRHPSHRASGHSQPKAQCGSLSARSRVLEQLGRCSANRTLVPMCRPLAQTGFQTVRSFLSNGHEAILSSGQMVNSASSPAIARRKASLPQEIFPGLSGGTRADLQVLARGYQRGIAGAWRSHTPDVLRAIADGRHSPLLYGQNATGETSRYLPPDAPHVALSGRRWTSRGFSQTTRGSTALISRGLPRATRESARSVFRDAGRENRGCSYWSGTCSNNTPAGSSGARNRPHTSDKSLSVKTSFNPNVDATEHCIGGMKGQ